MAFSLSPWSPTANHCEGRWAPNESVSRVRFALSCEEDQDSTGVYSATRWKWMDHQEADVPLG